MNTKEQVNRKSSKVLAYRTAKSVWLQKPLKQVNKYLPQNSQSNNEYLEYIKNNKNKYDENKNLSYKIPNNNYKNKNILEKNTFNQHNKYNPK